MPHGEGYRGCLYRLPLRLEVPTPRLSDPNIGQSLCSPKRISDIGLLKNSSNRATMIDDLSPNSMSSKSISSIRPVTCLHSPYSRRMNAARPEAKSIRIRQAVCPKISPPIAHRESKPSSTSSRPSDLSTTWALPNPSAAFHR